MNCIVLFIGHKMRYNKDTKEKKETFLMTVFGIVSAIVLFSILWDNTEEFRHQIWKEIGLE